jgi:hypothetical protein
LSLSAVTAGRQVMKAAHLAPYNTQWLCWHLTAELQQVLSVELMSFDKKVS